MSLEIREHEPLGRYAGWRIGGPARFFATASTAGELHDAVAWGRARELPTFILGGGTNILIADGGFPGLVIRNRAAHWHVRELGDEAVLEVEAGAPTAGTVRRLAGQGLGSLIWAEGLPGTIGGAIYGNAGCYGGDIAGHLLSARLLLPSGAIEEWAAERFRFRYRGSVLKPDIHRSIADLQGESWGLSQPGPVILEARLRLERGDPGKLAAEMAEIAAARKSKTPSGSSCGSSFKNPPGTTAGRLLDEAGLKGARIGGAVVSEKHANYIVNAGGATARDVLQLMELMRERVLERFGIELEPEVQVIGVGKDGA